MRDSRLASSPAGHYTAGQIDMDASSPWPLPDWLTRERLTSWRIWDCLFVPGGGSVRGTPEQAITELEPYFERFAIERLCAYFHLGMQTTPRQTEFGPEEVKAIERCLARWPKRLLGGIVLNAAAPDKCVEYLDRWIKDGPMVSVLFPSTEKTLPCSHPNFEKILPRAQELGALVVQHTWYKTGGKGSAGESTPAELAEVARRYPEMTFVCVHAGGEWEKGLRAIADCPNVLIETSGFDPTAGFVEMAVRTIGAKRVMFGRERSFATELAKVLGAEIGEDDKKLIFGGNLRRVLAPAFRRKGWPAP